MKLLFLLIGFSAMAQSETVCVYDITYPEFWDSTTTITKEALGHFETLFIDDVAQYETRDGVTRMIYKFIEHITKTEIRFYGGYSGTTTSFFSHCYEQEVLDTDDIVFDEINIYPNPTTGIIRIKGIDDLYVVVIFDEIGREVFKKKDIRGELNISDLKQGVYMLRIVKEKEIITKKIIKI